MANTMYLITQSYLILICLQLPMSDGHVSRIIPVKHEDIDIESWTLHDQLLG